MNKGLGAAISQKLGLTWSPGALYCCIHSVLGFQVGVKDLWMKCEGAIGNDKMYPSVTGFEMDMEDRSPTKQILEAFLRFLDHLKLLEVFPKLYQDLINYPESLAKIDRPGIPALAFA